MSQALKSGNKKKILESNRIKRWNGEMKNVQYNSVYSYLEEQGLLEGNPESIVNAKKVYWRDYRRSYMSSYQKKRITIALDQELYNALLTTCKELELGVCETVRRSLKETLHDPKRMIIYDLKIEIESVLLSCLDDIDECLENHLAEPLLIQSQKDLDALLTKIRRIDR
ncbi:MAG: hypothetical protein HKN39_02495 [Flavobacteriales bacterium]|nr:hypothetical protein [Flavobacteriales bacterium]